MLKCLLYVIKNMGDSNRSMWWCVGSTNSAKTVRETLPDYGEGLRVVGGFGCSRGLDVGDLGGGRESRLVIV